MQEIQKKMLNDKVVNAVNEQSVRKFAKNQEDYSLQVDEMMNKIIGKPSAIELNKLFKLDDVYLYAQQELAELLLRLM